MSRGKADIVSRGSIMPGVIFLFSI